MFSSEQRIKQIQEIQKNPKNIRNISIVAHVDHGKTTLSDSLISVNNIIHKKSAGKLRYLDSRKDEQERGITMKSSSISLIYHYPEKNDDFLINLIDSPGHSEFISEVQSALKLTDGALILVDVVEGVSPQTYSVVRQCYSEKIKGLLVLNKIDRLITELQMSPLQAYRHLCQIIEQMNAILGQEISADQRKQDFSSQQKRQKSEQQFSLSEEQYFEQIENQLYFSPQKGNIIFASAIDCWSFTIQDFAEIFSQKLACSKNLLQTCLFGDYYLNSKTKHIQQKPVDDKSNPMFVDFILKNIWTIYERVQSQETEKIEKLCKNLKIDLPEKFLASQINNSQYLIQYIMSNWLPLDQVILKTVVDKLPSAQEAQQDRLAVICKELSRCEENLFGDEEQKDLIKNYQAIKQSIQNCNQKQDAPIVIYVSKMINLRKDHINDKGFVSFQEIQKMSVNQSLGFARIFSGTIKKGQNLFVIGPKAREKVNDVNNTQINSLYLMMGSYMDAVAEIPAGNILAIGGLEQIVFKSATISSYDKCPPFSPIYEEAKSILKVGLSSERLEDQSQLIEGLKKLNKSDPSVDVYTQANGDLILATSGQVHLDRCIKDLQDFTNNIKIKVSEPIVSFKETIIYHKLRKVNSVKKQFSKLGQSSNKKTTNYQEESSDSKQEEKDQKMKMIKTLEDVEIVDVTKQEEESDIRYGLLQEQEKKQPKKIYYKQEKELKKFDYFNKGKLVAMMNQVNIMNLLEKENVVTVTTQNQKISMKIRAIGFNFELAEWLEKNQNLLKRFLSDQKLQYTFEELEQFLEKFNQKLDEFITDKQFKRLILGNLISFGPLKYGPNLLIVKNIDPSTSVIEQLKKRLENHKQTSNKESQVTTVKSEEQNQSEEKKIDQINHSSQEEEEKQKQADNQQALSQDNRKSSQDEQSVASSQNDQQKMKIFYDQLNQIYETFSIKPEETLNSIVQGFDMSVQAGPLCMEPMMGVCYIVENIQLNIVNNNKQQPLISEECNSSEQSNNQIKQQDLQSTIESASNEQPKQKPQEDIQQQQQQQKQQESSLQEQQKQQQQIQLQQESQQQQTKQQQQQQQQQPENEAKIQGKEEQKQFQNNPYGPISGQIIATVKEACFESFLGAQPRLVEGMYLCHLFCNNESYAKVWDILNKRRAKIIKEELQEQSNMFLIQAHFPIEESFGFYIQLQVETSGRANAQLVFDTWKILEIDPFYVPLTEEEIEENGDKILLPNLAKQLIDKMRKRKGISTEEKIVIDAEKQRNRSKKK